MKSDFLEPSLYKKMLPVMSAKTALALEISLATGLRVGDVLKIKLSDISGNKLKYVAQKTGKAGVKVLPDKILKKIPRERGDMWLFPSSKNPEKHLSRQAVYLAVEKAAGVVGIKSHVTPHSARKTYAVEVFRKKGLNAAQKELQHDSAGVTALYAFSDVIGGKVSSAGGQNCITDEQLERLAERIAALVFEKLLDARGTMW